MQLTPTQGFIPPRLCALRIALVFIGAFWSSGTAVAFFPLWLQARGLTALQIGMVLAAASWTQMVLGPSLAHVADRRGDRRRPIIAVIIFVLIAFILLGQVTSFPLLFVLWGCAGAAIQSTVPLLDNLTNLARPLGVDYGRVRLWGSAAFMIATVAGSLMFQGTVVTGVWWAMFAGYVLAFMAANFLPDLKAAAVPAQTARLRGLLKHPTFLVFLLSSAMLQASHGALYGFATLHWQTAGYSGLTIGGLWAEGVIVEILLFALAGRIFGQVKPHYFLIIAACGGLIRWPVLAFSTALPALWAVQALHSVTFGAAHLGAIGFISRAAPVGLGATTQAIYTAVSGGAAMGLSIALSGWIYGRWGGLAFLAMAGLSLIGGIAALMVGRLWQGTPLATE